VLPLDNSRRVSLAHSKRDAGATEVDLPDIASDVLARVPGQRTRPYRLNFKGAQGRLFQDALVPRT
jgi:hypothetical protein